MESSFNFYKADSVYGNLFFKFPKALIYSDKYKFLSSDAKIAYIILKDRLEFSLKNDWVDENGNVYFIFTIKEMQELFNVTNKTAIKIKKELESANLLLQKKRGFNKKTGQNEPNRLYLAELQTNVPFLYKKKEYINPNRAQTLATSGSVNSTLPEKLVSQPSKTLATSGSVNSTLPKKKAKKANKTLAASGSVNSTLNKDKDLDIKKRYFNESKKLDLKATNEKLNLNKTNFSEKKLKLQDEDLEEHAVEIYKNELTSKKLIFNWEIMHLLWLWTDNPKTRNKLTGIILRAKKNVEKENKQIKLDIKDDKLQKLIALILRRCFKTIRTKNVSNQEGYIYQSLKNLFISYWNKYNPKRNNGQKEIHKNDWKTKVIERFDSKEENNSEEENIEELNDLIKEQEEIFRQLEISNNFD